MHAMQYEITLPADYDVKIIRNRVAAKGPILDSLPDLGVKAYLLRERGVDGSLINQYAPFYLWTTVDGMNNFLFGGGFGGIVDSFGRPSVLQWSGIAFAYGPDRDGEAHLATRRIRSIHGDTEATGTIDAAIGELRERSTVRGVHSTALALDTRTWELVDFTLWTEATAATDGIRYEVLYLSTPHMTQLKVGCHW